MYTTQLGHVHLKVRDLQRSVAFYTRFLNLREVERIGDHYAFLSAGAPHHELALQSVGPLAPAANQFGVGLYHIAFEVPSKIELARAYAALSAANIGVTLVDQRISWAIYFSDPDGNGLEIFCDTRTSAAADWQGHSRILPAELLCAELATQHAAP